MVSMVAFGVFVAFLGISLLLSASLLFFLSSLCSGGLCEFFVFGSGAVSLRTRPNLPLAVWRGFPQKKGRLKVPLEVE